MTNIKTENRITKLETCVGTIEKNISEINLNLNNHVNDLSKKLDRVETKTDTISNDMAWLKKFFWVLATAFIGAIATAIINLIKSTK
jgi:uncharacterized coiled-coil protein SlyX